MGVGYLSKILGLKLFKFILFLAETTTEEALISFGSKIPAETPTVTVTPETLPELTTIPFADEIVTKSTTVTPSPQGDLENELFDPTQAPEELEDDLFDTTIMPDLSKSTTEKTMPAGKFWNKKTSHKITTGQSSLYIPVCINLVSRTMYSLKPCLP